MRRKITITNKTDFSTRNLRSIILAVARRELKPNQYRHMLVTIGYPRRTYVTGGAVINRASKVSNATAIFSIFIPKDQVDVVEVIHRVKVCLDYVKGAHGGNDGTSFNDWRQRPGKATDYPFAKKFGLPKEVQRVKSKLKGAAGAMKKAEHAQDKVHYWERKSKYAQTMLKKWRRQLKYHAARGEELHVAEATALEQQQGMSVEEFLKLPPVGDKP